MNHSIDQRHRDSDLFGLLYGFSFRPGERGREIDSAKVLECLKQPADTDEFLWLHLNLAHAACERWMKTHLELPEEFFEALHEGSRSTRIEHVDTALLAVVNDVVFNLSSMVSSDISTLWVCARSRLIISVRLQRLLALEPGSLLRLLNRPPQWLQKEDVKELRKSTEEFALIINDLTALGERIKLLQEEIAANLNEQSNRTLFTLTVVTVLALPINIIAGFFG